MVKRCWGVTWGFNRCNEERQKMMVCRKHIWQLVQVIVLFLVIGAVIITVELVKIYESRLATMQKDKQSVAEKLDVDEESGVINKSVNTSPGNNDYQSWDN